MTAIFEGRWRCTSCTAENKGRAERCDGCGVARPAGVQFYLPGNEPVVRDADLLADAHSGRDWYCDHCDGANKNAVNGVPVTQCENCGQGRDADDTTHVVAGEAAPSPRVKAASPRAQAARAAEQLLRDDRRQSRLRSGQNYRVVQWVAVVCAVLIGIFVVWAAVWALRTHVVSATVTQTSWERSIPVERMEVVRKSGWSKPAGARVIRSDRRKHGTRDVLVSDTTRTVTSASQCGTRDKGNGFFEARSCTIGKKTYRDEDVIDTWYVYDQDVWRTVRSCPSRGIDNAPFWADCPTRGRSERLGSRSGRYIVNLSLGDTSDTLQMREAEWSEITAGDLLTVNVSRNGKTRSIATKD